MLPAQPEPDLEEEWSHLQVGIEKIFATKISQDYYIELYDKVYAIFTKSSKPQSVARRLCQKVSAFLRDQLRGVFETFDGLVEDPLLTHYVLQWEDYCSSSLSLHAVFGYMNRNYCRFEDADTDMLEVYRLALIAWKECVLVPLQGNLSSAVRKLVERRNDGETIEMNLVGATVNSCIEMGLDYRNDPNFGVFRGAFEGGDPLEAELLFVQDSASMFKNSVFVFMKKIDVWLEEQGLLEEVDREPSRALEETLQKVLENYNEVFFKEFRSALERNKIEDLETMHRFTIPGNLMRLEEEFESYVTALGNRVVERYEELGVDYPGRFVHIVFVIHQRYSWMVREAFAGRSVFFDALDRACKSFINQDLVLKSSGIRTQPAELLARYFDGLLKDATRLYAVVDGLNKSMIMYKYIEDKATFQTLYTEMMGTRLLQHVYTNESKASIISKLQETMGFGFPYMVNTLRMFREVQTSRELTASFKDTLVSELDFNINIIKYRFWQVRRFLTFTLPEELDAVARQFTLFYGTQHSDKKLIWLNSMSSCELAASCFGKPYVFRASALQTALLLQFNSADTLSFSQLEAATGIQSDVLLQLLQVLVDQRILRGVESGLLTTTSSLSLGLEYEHKDSEVDIHVPVREEVRRKQRRLYQNVEEDRRILVEATIVRIAKSRKEVQLQELLRAVVDALSSRFEPETSVIQKCIDKLIEKEYLIRENDTYYYVV